MSTLRGSSRMDHARGISVGVALSATLVSGPAAAYHFEDSLRGTTRGNLVGGVVMADGWHVTDRTDRVWYAVPRLTSGAVEFTVARITMASLGDTSDNELFAMYEAGYGITEPVRYAPEFRENHYKCMLRVYANGETSRAGFQKLMWGMCPSGAPGYGACACASSFFEEPFAGPGGWDGSPQRLRVEWGSGATRYLRNGRTIVTIDWSRSGVAFGPSELHVSLGTSRPSGVDSAQLPVGAVFSDLVIDGEEGPLARCPSAPVADAGTTPDAAPPVMTGDVLELSAVEDVTVAPGLPSAVYPDVNDLSVGAGDSEFYVKFRVPALRGRVVRAQLVLQSSAHRSATGTGASVFAASSAAWSETALTWSARPGPRGARLARIDGVSVDTSYTVDLPAGAVSSDGLIALAVLPEPTDSDSAHFDSKDLSASRGPRLRITLDPSAPSDASVASDVTAVDVTTARDVTNGRDAVSTPDVTDATDAAPHDATADAQRDVYVPSGGCGCRASARGAAPRGLGAWLLLLFARAARRARRSP